ncbi:MAG: hypothetical protein GF341_13650 [candidate division Zixibacteria bacterium]|nr:hypothetical protein [candidate division Zixibacteria bacterium]
MCKSTRVFVLSFILLALTFYASAGYGQVTCGETYLFQGDSRADRFGRAVSGAGDVDNDGYDDVIIGAWGNDAGGPDAGQAYIYSGQTGAVIHTIIGTGFGDNVGWSVSDFTDVNTDGHADVIIGARDAGGTGEAYVISGIDGSILHTFTGVVADDKFGFSVSGAGDVNMDGRIDLIVGAPSPAPGNPGNAYIYSGLDYSELYAFSGEAADDGFGRSVACAGDVNNDGYDDVIVGADLNDAGGSDAGRAYVYSGQDGSLLHTFTGEATQNFFGFDVDGGVDLDTDGFPDLIVGATGAAGTGKTYAFSGQDGSLLYDLTGEAVDDEFGRAVSGTGDLTGDGIPELIIGAKFNDAGDNNAGRVYIHSGFDGTLLHVFTGQGIRRNLGTDVSSAGDVNRDGVDDIIIGGPRRGAGLARVYTCLSPGVIPTLTDIGAVIFGALLLVSIVLYVRRRSVQHA